MPKCLLGRGGGGSSVLSPGAQPSSSLGAPGAAAAYGTITFHIPAKPRTTSGSRKPAYISPGTTSGAVFIDGATAPAGSATCASPSCTITWTADIYTTALHSFAVEIDNGTNVLAENKASYLVHSGNNGALAALTLNGVAASAALTAETCTGTTCTGTLRIADAAGDPITNSGSNPSFDNGTITFASATPATGTVNSGGAIATVSAAGTYNYTTVCSASTGQFLTTMTASVPAGSGDITSAERATRGLQYPATINSLENYTCTTAAAILPGHIYTAAGGQVLVFAGNPSGTVTNAPIAAISAAAPATYFGNGIALDSSGKIYVNAGNSSYQGYAVLAANPSGNFSEAPLALVAGSNTTLNGPVDVSVGPTGTIAIANNNSCPVDIFSAYPATGNLAPIASLEESGGSCFPYGAKFDSSGRIYMVQPYNEYGQGVGVFAANPSGAVAATVAEIYGAATLLNDTEAVAIDSSGRIYVSNDANGTVSSQTITVYAANPSGVLNEAPLLTIGGASTQLNDPKGIAFDSSGRIYVANLFSSDILVFSAYPAGGNEAPIARILGPYANGVAIR